MKLSEVIAKVKSLEAKVASFQNTETRNCQLAKDVPENKEIISEFKKMDVFQTKIVNAWRTCYEATNWWIKKTDRNDQKLYLLIKHDLLYYIE